jgi:predicted N-acetyltransferase YhbS
VPSSSADAAAPPSITPERPTDAAAVEALIDRAFGPGRFAKAAERLREGRPHLVDLSRVARADGAVVGCARLWPVTAGAAPALLLGPFAVDEAFRHRGLGGALIRHACEAAAGAGHGLILLVGDEPYFTPFGFFAEGARRLVLPGPVDQGRVLARALKPGAADELAGEVRPCLSPSTPGPT